ncbi:MAG: hypothetical protein M3Y24_03185 [Acidobacteriota bacterium]|nr:hypothetical protein [Acidobacteriota bacterium]
MAATSMPLPRLICLPIADADFSMQSSADQLCDQLTEHILECDLCLYGNEYDCALYSRLQEQIAATGGSKTGLVFAF